MRRVQKVALARQPNRRRESPPLRDHGIEYCRAMNSQACDELLKRLRRYHPIINGVVMEGSMPAGVADSLDVLLTEVDRVIKEVANRDGSMLRIQEINTVPLTLVNFYRLRDAKAAYDKSVGKKPGYHTHSIPEATAK